MAVSPADQLPRQASPAPAAAPALLNNNIAGDAAVMLKFIATDASKLGQKRKQCQRACGPCRARKKRCSHVDIQRTVEASVGSHAASPAPFHDASTESMFHSPADGLYTHPSSHENNVPRLGASIRSSSTLGAAASRLNDAAESHRPESNDGGNLRQDTEDDADPVLGSRFIGDLNPEGLFRAATSPTVTTGADQTDRIGIWLTERLSKSRATSGPPSDQAESSMYYGFDPLIQKVMIPLLAEECSALLPPQPEVEKLCSIYFERHHPIFPIVDKTTLRAMPSGEPASVLLKQGMCLVASLNLSAKGHLRLPKASSVLSPREFGRRISAAMRTSVELGLVTKKVVIIQALALLSFFIDGPNGGDVSSQLCGRAVHYIHSMGLHIQTQQQGQDDQYAQTLLCCIWALDRLNAALHGRPVLMHERDLGRDLNACFQAQNVCFRLFLRVAMLLDNVIGLYRPSDEKDVGPSAEFPLFEELLDDVGGAQIPTSLLSKFLLRDSDFCDTSRTPDPLIDSYAHTQSTSNNRDSIPCHSYPLLPHKIPIRTAILEHSLSAPKPFCDPNHVDSKPRDPKPTVLVPLHPVRHIPLSERCLPRDETQQDTHVSRTRTRSDGSQLRHPAGYRRSLLVGGDDG